MRKDMVAVLKDLYRHKYTIHFTSNDFTTPNHDSWGLCLVTVN